MTQPAITQATVFRDVTFQLKGALVATTLTAVILLFWNNIFGISDGAAHCIRSVWFSLTVWLRVTHFEAVRQSSYLVSAGFLVGSLLAAGGAVAPGYRKLRIVSVCLGNIAGAAMWLSYFGFVFNADISLSLGYAWGMTILGCVVTVIFGAFTASGFPGNSGWKGAMLAPAFHTLTPLFITYLGTLAVPAFADDGKSMAVFDGLNRGMPAGAGWLAVLILALVIFRTNIYDLLDKLTSDAPEDGGTATLSSTEEAGAKDEPAVTAQEEAPTSEAGPEEGTAP